MKKEKYNVAVVGATGAVGEQMREVLEERQFPVGELRLLASERSAGQFLPFQGRQIRVEILTEDSFRNIDLGLFSAGSTVSAKFAPIAVANGAVVVDNTGFFRMEPDIPLVVPEVNAKEIAKYNARGIIANPNCSTIQMVVALKPIHDVAAVRPPRRSSTRPRNGLRPYRSAVRRRSCRVASGPARHRPALRTRDRPLPRSRP